MQVLARIPADVGKQIQHGHDHVYTVAVDDCDDCGQPAVVVIRGETDSFGFEPVLFCQECFDRSETDDEAYKAAMDVEDRPPAPGHLFLVSEGTNYDGHGDWCRSFTSFQSASAFLRCIGEKADPWGGLYPDNGVQELPEAEVKARLRRYREHLQREMEEASASLPSSW